MKLWILLVIGVSVLAGCDKGSDPYKNRTTGAGGGGPGYDGTGSGPEGTNINRGNEAPEK